MSELISTLDLKTLYTSFDIRTETLAAALLTQMDLDLDDFHLERIIVSPLGPERRRASHDVAEIKEKRFEDEHPYILMKVNRKGLFDTLPIGLFIKPEEKYEDSIERTRAFKEQIEKARQFFLPFERAIYHPRVESERVEQRYTETFPRFIHNIWGLNEFEDCLDDRQRFLLCYLLPEAYRVAGDWELTGRCLEAVLQKPVDLKFIAPIKHDNPNGDQPGSGMRLGVDAITGDSFRDDMPALEITVRAITNKDLPDYLESGKRLRLLEELLCSYFIPLDVPRIIKIMVTEDSLDFNLGDSILGYNVKFTKDEHLN